MFFSFKKLNTWYWIVGGIFVIAVGVAIIEYFNWVWLILFLFLAAGAGLWRQRRGMAEVLICIGVVWILLAGAVSLALRVKISAAKSSAQIEAGTHIPKPPAGVPAVAPVAQPSAPDAAIQKQLTEVTAKLEKVQAALDAINKKGGEAKGEDEKDNHVNPPAPVPSPNDDVSGIAPVSGDEGPIMMRMKSCWFSNPGEMSCKGFVYDRDQWKKTFYLMDSDGTVQIGQDEGHNFTVWTSGGSIQFMGGGNMKVLDSKVITSFVFKFAEPDNRATKVALNLHFMGPDAINHIASFTDIRVNAHPY